MTDLERMLELNVKHALNVYQQTQGMDAVAGYDIVRFAKRGMIKVNDNVDATRDFMDWYPRDQTYTILRLVKQGKMSYTGPEANAIDGDK